MMRSLVMARNYTQDFAEEKQDLPCAGIFTGRSSALAGFLARCRLSLRYLRYKPGGIVEKALIIGASGGIGADPARNLHCVAWR